MNVTHYTQKTMAHILEDIIRGYADEVASAVCFSWVPSATAPSTFEDLLQAYRVSRDSGNDFPVWDGASDTSIWGSSAGNMNFRFVHDIVAHALGGLTFSDDDEKLAGQVFAAAMYNRALRTGYSEIVAQRVHDLSLIDTAGQIIYKQHFGDFPKDQTKFAYGCISVAMSYGWDVKSHLGALVLMNE